MSKLTNTRRGGFYWKNGKPYLSVTEILKIIDKPSLAYWKMQEVYYAMLKNPSLDEKEALSIPSRTSSMAKERGTTVHSIVEAYKNTGEIIDKIPDQFKGYAQAFYDFMKNFNIEIIEQEKSIFSEKHKIAGTLDMLMTVNGKQMIVDVKTGKSIYLEAGLQLSAYAEMMRENDFVIDDIAVLLLETGKDGLPTGKYQFKTMEDDFDTFEATKKLYTYINHDKCLRVGYL